jgi:hypothetical protein
VFEQVRKIKFGNAFQGSFRHAHGKPLFPKLSAYKGGLSFSSDQCVLVNDQTGEIKALNPLIYWNACSKHSDLESGHCYIFDKANDHTAEYSFKAVGYPCAQVISKMEVEYEDIFSRIAALRLSDPKMESFAALDLQIFLQQSSLTATAGH